MRIKLNINESSMIEIVPLEENYEPIQGECCVTVLELNFPETIKGYPINNYDKYIEFAECVEVGPCVKFLDNIEGNEYELKEPATNFEKIKVQFTLKNTTDKPGNTIVWRSKIFELDFGEAINAESTAEIQTQLISLKTIEDNWENYITANCFTVVYKHANLPEANANNLDKTIFYLAENTNDFTYGHYYRCVSINGVYSWSDLTQDPSLDDGVADGIREINKSRTMQVFVGSKDEINAQVKEAHVIYRRTDELDIVNFADDERQKSLGEAGIIAHMKDIDAIKNPLILETGQTGSNTSLTADVEYDMPESMNIEGKYRMEIGTGEIVEFCTSSGTTRSNVYTYYFSTTRAAADDIGLGTVQYVFDFNNKKITIPASGAKYKSVANGCVTWIKPHIVKLWKINN